MNLIAVIPGLATYDFTNSTICIDEAQRMLAYMNSVHEDMAYFTEMSRQLLDVLNENTAILEAQGVICTIID